MRIAGCSAVTDLDGRNLKAQLKQADRLAARYALLIGDDEMASGTVTVRDLATGEQQSVARADLVEALK